MTKFKRIIINYKKALLNIHKYKFYDKVGIGVQFKINPFHDNIKR